MEVIKEAYKKQQITRKDNTECNNFRLNMKHDVLLNRKQEQGITLVALVITTIVLLILAGVVVKLSIGDNGVVSRTKDAANKYDASQSYEIGLFNDIANEYDKIIAENWNIGGSGGNAGDENQSGNNTNTTPGGDEPIDPVDPVETPIEEIKSDWETIEKIAIEIANDDSITNEDETATVIVENKKYTITVGDIFEVNYDGTPIQVRVLGFKHDDLVNTGAYGGEHDKASISFECIDAIDIGQTRMGTGSASYSGWGVNSARDRLGVSSSELTRNEPIGEKGLLFENHNYIKLVKKKFWTRRVGVDTSWDYIWLLGASEIVKDGHSTGSFGDSDGDEGGQYKYYQKFTDSYNSRCTERAKGFDCWLRSGSYYENQCCILSSTGNLSSANIGAVNAMSPGFCI